MSNLSDIQNLTAAELKSRRMELAVKAEQAPRSVVATRYIQALIDAKMRDERMAAMGQRIKELEEAASEARIVERIVRTKSEPTIILHEVTKPGLMRRLIDKVRGR